MAKTENGANDANPAHAKKLQMGQSASKSAKTPEPEEKTDGDATEET